MSNLISVVLEVKFRIPDLNENVRESFTQRFLTKALKNPDLVFSTWLNYNLNEGDPVVKYMLICEIPTTNLYFMRKILGFVEDLIQKSWNQNLIDPNWIESVTIKSISIPKSYSEQESQEASLA